MPNPNPNLDSMPAGEGSSANAALDRAEVLSREEVLRRRSRRAKQLARVYRRHYWALVEEIRVKHRDYYWEFGKSPLAAAAVAEENGSEEAGERKRCGSAGCKSKAMPLTKFCHQHICQDRKQTLYKPCPFVTKRFFFYMFNLPGEAKLEWSTTYTWCHSLDLCMLGQQVKKLPLVLSCRGLVCFQLMM